LTPDYSKNGIAKNIESAAEEKPKLESTTCGTFPVKAMESFLREITNMLVLLPRLSFGIWSKDTPSLEI
jgi:hypothetical protein